jgi:uncharacterized protein (TIGR03437 family)
MDLSVLRRRSSFAFGGLVALTVCAGSMQATTYLSALATSASALTSPGVTCSTQNGPPLAGQTFTVHAFGAPSGYSIVVGVVPVPGLRITPPASVTLTAATNTVGLVFTVNSAAGCSNATVASANTLTSGANSIPIQLTAALNAGGAANDNSVTVTDTITATTSPLTVSAVTITCGYNSVGPVYVPGAPRAVSVTSAANLGTPVTVVPGTVSGGVITPAALPSWLILSPSSPSGTAGANAFNFTVQASPNCGTFAGVQQTYALPLSNAPAPAVTVLITLNSGTISPLTVTPVPAAATISMSYVKSSGAAGIANVLVTSTLPNAFFTLNTATLPLWLTVNLTAGTVPTGGKPLQFSTTTQTDTLAPGTYTATVYLSVAGYADYPIPINLLVTNKAPKLSVTSANPMPVNYTLGGSSPVTTISVASSDSPIPYSITLAGPLAPQLAPGEQATGIAYSFGTNISIVYNPLLFSTSPPGTVLSGTVTFTWGSPASVIVVTINLTVNSPGATITSISPATLPTAAPGTVFHVSVIGSGFVGGTDPTLATKVGIVTGASPGTLTADTNFKVTYNSPANLDLQITVPTLGAGNINGDPNLPFLVGGPGGSIFLGVANGSTTIPTGTQTLTVGAGPIIYGVTSSSSFTEVSGGNLPQFAPYDMISIFGSNFCSSLNTGCSSTQILNTGPDAVTLRFPFTLSPDALPASGPDIRRQLSVTFYPHGTLASGLPAPLLFTSNTQINAIVPGAVLAAPTLYDIVVSFGCPLCTPSTVVNSVPFPVNTVAVDPGIFTVGSDGQGPAAALAGGTYALINSSSPAGMRFTSGQSDTIQIYMTGLGLPGAGAAYTSNNGLCINALSTGYLAALAANTPAASGFTTIDGDVLQSALYPGDLPPCLTTEPTVTIGGVATPAVTYSAFVADTVTGLYQVNVQLPATQNTFYPSFPSLTGPITNLTGPKQLPVFVTLGGVTSQAGVMLSVAPQLLMAPPAFTSGTMIDLSIGHAYSDTITGSNNGSHAGVTYAVSSGVLPKGLTLTTAAGVGTIAGTPAQGTMGTYPITVTATDSSAVPITGSSSFTYVVPGGLFITNSNPTTSTFATANAAIATVTAVGGTAPYNQFAITSPVTPIAGLSITAGGVLQTDGTTPAGVYLITVTATDAAGLTGTVSFSFTVNVQLTYAPNPTTTVTAADTTTTITQVTAHGGSGSYTYSLDAGNTINALLLHIDPVTGILKNNGAADTTPTMSVIIDVTDTGSAPTGGTSAATGTITITVTISG